MLHTQGSRTFVKPLSAGSLNFKITLTVNDKVIFVKWVILIVELKHWKYSR